MNSIHDEDDDEYVQAQLEAIAEMEHQEQEAKQAREQLDEIEDYSVALAEAMGASEQEWIDQSTRLEAKRRIEEQNYEAAQRESEAEFRVQKTTDEMERQVLTQKRQRNEERNSGSWDCPACTYTNQPYRGRCEACDGPSPPHVLTFCSFRTLRFGVEIEIIIPDGKRDGYSLKRVASELTRLGPPKVTFAGYSHDVSAHWKIVTDRSVSSEQMDDDLCFELVSPILKGEEGLVSLRALLDNVRKLGIKSNSTCGFHVHVDATKATNPLQEMPSMGTLTGLKRVVQCFVALENAFDLIVARSWDNNHKATGRRSNGNDFCRSNLLAFGSMSNRQRWEQLDSVSNYTQLVRLTNPHNDRYRKLNLTNITNRDRPSTCEFRHHGGVEELLQAEAWVRLVIRFCEKASSMSHDEDLILPQGSSPRDEVRALFRLLDCEGLTQYFVTEKRLFVGRTSSSLHRETLRNDWQCNYCEKKFLSSRALAQHSHMTGHS